MDEQRSDKSASPDRSQSSEYGDALSDVLKDQVRRDGLRATATPTPVRTRVHPSAPPVLALLSIWLWAFPPAALIPEVPTIPPAAQEAGLRMNMLIQVNQIQQFRSDYGRLPENLDELGDRPDGVQYTRLSDGTFQLRGKSGDVTVDWESTESVDELVDVESLAIVRGVPSTPEVGGADD